MSSAFAINTDHDTYLVGGQIALVEGSEQILQNLRTRLRLYLGEWFLDTADGTPWFQKILRKPMDEGEIETELQRRILQTEGIESLISFDATFNAQTRQFSLTFEAATADGPTGQVVVNV